MNITRVGDILCQEFMAEFYNRGISVIFMGVAHAWQVPNLLTPEWPAGNFGDRATKRG